MQSNDNILDKFNKYINKSVNASLTPTSNVGNIQEYSIACNIVDELFYHINLCIDSDRSKTKLNGLEKGIIKGMLSKKTLNGINEYIMNMYEPDIRNLMKDILNRIPREMMVKFIPVDIMEYEIKRRKIVNK